MANQHASEKASLLWTIGPAAVLLTLLFVSVNNNTIGPKTRLMGEHGGSTKKEHVAAPDSTGHAADTTLHEATHVEMPAKEKAPSGH